MSRKQVWLVLFYATYGIVAGAVGGPLLATFLLKRHPTDKAQP